MCVMYFTSFVWVSARVQGGRQSSAYQIVPPYSNSNNNYAYLENRMRWCLVSPFAIFFCFVFFLMHDDDDFPVLKINLAITCFEVKCATWLSINFMLYGVSVYRQWISTECDMRFVWISFRWSRIAFEPFLRSTIFFWCYLRQTSELETRPKHLLIFLCRTFVPRSLWHIPRLGDLGFYSPAPLPRVRWSTNSMTCEISLTNIEYRVKIVGVTPCQRNVCLFPLEWMNKKKRIGTTVTAVTSDVGKCDQNYRAGHNYSLCVKF